MCDVDIAARRSQMGQALGEWVSAPTMVHEVGPTSWIYLSGAPTAYVNLALIHQADERALSNVVAAADYLKCPTLLMFAGQAKSLAPESGGGWPRVGTMPFMTISTDTAPRRLDARVRRAHPEDANAVIRLLTDAFGFDPDVAAIFAAPLHRPASTMKTWLLEDEGEAVSTVMTCRVEDSVTIWCMATPPRFSRRGYARALLADVLARAAAENVPVALLAATPAGRPLYETTGWRTLEDWELYVCGGSSGEGT